MIMIDDDFDLNGEDEGYDDDLYNSHDDYDVDGSL